MTPWVSCCESDSRDFIKSSIRTKSSIGWQHFLIHIFTRCHPMYESYCCHVRWFIDVLHSSSNKSDGNHRITIFLAIFDQNAGKWKYFFPIRQNIPWSWLDVTNPAYAQHASAADEMSTILPFNDESLATKNCHPIRGICNCRILNRTVPDLKWPLQHNDCSSRLAWKSIK